MAEDCAEKNPEWVSGIDFYASGAPYPPTETTISGPELHTWFSSHPEDTWAAIRLATRYDERKAKRRSALDVLIPFTEEIVKHAIWSQDDYRNLWNNPAGGCAALTDNPYRFIMQTPLDGGPFCSFALSCHGHRIKGVYMYDNASYEPTRVLSGENIDSGWRSSGFQIVCLPHAFLRMHSARIAKDLGSVVDQVTGAENTLAEISMSSSTMRDFASLNRTLHTCSAALVNLERRSRFESKLVESIEHMIEFVKRENRFGPSLPWAPLAPQKNAISSRAYDIETLPRRIQEARATIFNLILQHNQQMSLDIAESSKRIAEATMSDSASMKTIAILTMVFLPGTAVASFFSMTMFNWTPNQGQSMASQYLWIYFVVAVPATAAVLAVWLVHERRRKREMHRRQAVMADVENEYTSANNNFSYIQRSPTQSAVELVEVHVNRFDGEQGVVKSLGKLD